MPIGIATPSEAGAVGAFGALVLAAANRKLGHGILADVCHSSARTVAMIFFIIISATCFAYVYRSLGGDDIVEHLIFEAGLDSWGLLFLIMAIVFILGFFLDWIEITLIVLPVFAPLVAGLDFGDHVAKADITYWFVSGREQFQIKARYFDQTTYERALRDAGFVDVIWQPLRLDPSGVEDFGREYWQEYMGNPPIVGLECRLPL